MKNKLNWLGILTVICVINFPVKVLSHGTKITYQEAKAVEITAHYDSGQPTSNAQVIIYNPNDPTTPWLKGMTDEEGKFAFVPDYSIVGNWTIKVRTGGHGSIINIPIDSGETTSETVVKKSDISKENQRNPSDYNTLQKLMMAITGVWGFVGTAFFFSQKKV